MKGSTQTYHSYGNIYASTAEVFYPKTIQELQEILAFCRQNGRKITPAGSFHSFDRQNAGKDVVISMKHFDQITCDAQEGILVVGSGASWGEIFEVVYEQDCLLYTCITGSAPTAGGTLSVNSYSIWSPGVGKEGCHCLSFKIVTTEGELFTCSRTENSDLFYGVIGGMGLLGFVVEITYKILPVSSPLEIDIQVKDYDNINDLEARLDLRKAQDLSTLEDVQSQCALFYMHQGQPQFIAVDRSYKKVPTKRKGSKLTFLAAVLASGLIRFFPELGNKIIYKDKHKPASKRTIFKNLNFRHYGTFWAQPDYEWSKKFSRFFQKLGYEPKMYQNCYFIPNEGNKTTQFVKQAYALSENKQLKTFMFDVTYSPQDEPFVLSHATHIDGFLVNITFMEKNDQRDILAAFQQLNQLAWEMGGNLNLGKNCFIEPNLLEKMYAPALEKFVQLKQQYDPSNLLSSDFFEHYFPSFFLENKGVETLCHAL